MNKATIIEVVLFKTNEGVNPEQFKVEMARYNNFLKKCDGFISRKIGVSADGQYLDVMYFTDLDACNACAKKAEQDADLMAFQVSVMDSKIDPSSVYTSRFKVLNDMSVEASTPTIAEVFIMKPKRDVESGLFESAMIKFNDTLANYKGIILRENGVSPNGQYLELVYWTGLDAIKSANEKVIEFEGAEIGSFFDMTDEEAEIVNRFEIFCDV